MPFKTWLSAVGKHVAPVADWSEVEWQAVFESNAGEIDDAVLSSDPATPPIHIAVLAWIREHGPTDIIARRLSWIAIEPKDGAVSVEAASGDAVFLDLPPGNLRTTRRRGSHPRIGGLHHRYSRAA